MNIGFQRLRSGAKAIILVPSALGFQDRDDLLRIPPDSNLIYEVEFLGFD
ncbi:FKBP-type peptidylprolyl isomerase [Nitritalea halalkaliphila LW7]|uniref:Peptidyl-prolyl cis-trans isomerase n=1 Tax=Nitritalea halalkaliphila LW7 TaxID=1189621 RepID=I5BVW3_9BACT|nr:FKBP-type peptidyl-prolyl cis-trans isomerase [Nitritalea halalkaliphila]EIM73715.1 FKBP-type peptidylprolyl isomerase [Nitritalea halalkaliphila LW7]